MRNFILNNEVLIPKIGLGTHGIDKQQLPNVLQSAYELGYRKFDTAWLYDNETVIGNWMQDNNINRDSLFITTKIHINDLFPLGYRKQLHIPIKTIRRAFFQSCKRLKTDYIDLYLIHWPFPNWMHMWEELQKLYSEGYIKAIGVSSFLIPHLETLKANFDVIPMVNQFEINPYNTQKRTVGYCRENNIQVEAYATFGTKQNYDEASQTLLNEKCLLDICRQYNKTPSQIILKWVVQQGVSVIPRSKSEVHLRENMEIFDFELSSEEMATIDNLNKNVYSRGNPHCTLK